MKSLLILIVVLPAVLAACSPEPNAGAEEQAYHELPKELLEQGTVTSGGYCQLRKDTFVFNDEPEALRGLGALFKSSDKVTIIDRSTLNGKAFLVVTSDTWPQKYSGMQLVVGGNACVTRSPAEIEPQNFCVGGKPDDEGEGVEAGDRIQECPDAGKPAGSPGRVTDMNKGGR